MVALRLDLFGIVHQHRIFRQIEPRPLRLRQPILHPYESAHDLPKVHFRDDVRAIDADTKPRNVHSFADHVDGHQPLLFLMGTKFFDRARSIRVVRYRYLRFSPGDAGYELSHPAGMVLIHTDNQSTGIRLLFLPKTCQLRMGIGDDWAEPSVLQQRRFQPFTLPIERQPVLKCRLMLATV